MIYCQSTQIYERKDTIIDNNYRWYWHHNKINGRYLVTLPSSLIVRMVKFCVKTV